MDKVPLNTVSNFSDQKAFKLNLYGSSTYEQVKEEDSVNITGLEQVEIRVESQNSNSYIEDERNASHISEIQQKSKVFHTPNRSTQFKTKHSENYISQISRQASNLRKTVVFDAQLEDLKRRSPLASPINKPLSQGTPKS